MKAFEQKMETRKKLETEIDEICKKGGYPKYNKPYEIAKEIKEKFQIVKEECDRYPFIQTIIVPKDTELNYLDYDSLVVLDYDIDLLMEEPEYPFIRGDILINKDIDKSKNKLIIVYLDHPAIDKRSRLYPGITSLKDLKNITDCFVPYKYLLYKINIDDNSVEHLEYSKILLYHDPYDNINIDDSYLDIRNYELYTIKEINLLDHHINIMSNLAKRGYDNRTIEEQYREFIKEFTRIK